MVGNANTRAMLLKLVRQEKAYHDRFGKETEADEVKQTFGNSGEVDALDAWATDPKDAAYLAKVGMEYI